MHIAIVAGEVSGDRLGGALLTALKKRYPTAQFSGVGGAEMSAAGLASLFPLERLAVMGLVEVLRHLPDLWAARRQLLRFWRANPPDLFIGIDAPDFNLPLAAILRAGGAKTAHYVSPSLWAWKEKRIDKIARSVDLMLCLFPFETAVYQRHNVRAVCVGHPMRDYLPHETQQQARARLALPPNVPVLGLFPGSRRAEVARLLPIFLRTFQQLQHQIPNLHGVLSTLRTPANVVLPAGILASDADSAQLMTASDVVLVASGTITLEAALLARPQVVAYRVHPLTALIARRLLRIERFALPNILLGGDVVPECMQENCTPAQLVAALAPLFAPPAATAQCRAFARLPALLPSGVSQRAAEALATLLEGN